MRIGFTGTRRSMTPAQYERVFMIWHNLGGSRAFHGGAVGADRQFHEISYAAPHDIYPSNEEQHRWALERCEGRKDVIHPIAPPLLRNQRIVENAAVMIAAPAGWNEQFRGSGTWATIRYARKRNRHLIICWPDGSLTEENQP